MLCKKCGHYLYDTTKFCPHCGAKNESQPGTCAKCGAKLENGVQFCAECGEPVIHSPVQKEHPAVNKFEYSRSPIDLMNYARSYCSAPISTLEEFLSSNNRVFTAIILIVYAIATCIFYPLTVSKVTQAIFGYSEPMDGSVTMGFVACGLIGSLLTVLFSAVVYFVVAKLHKAWIGFSHAIGAAVGTTVIPTAILFLGIIFDLFIPKWSLVIYAISQISWWIMGIPAVMSLLPDRDEDSPDSGKLWLSYFVLLLVFVIVGFSVLVKIDLAILDIEGSLESALRDLLFYL